MTLAQRALERLAAWPDLSEGPASCGTGRALLFRHGDLVHFHSDRDVDLHLTVRAIERFREGFQGSTALRLVPGSRWVTVHLDCDTDVDLLLSLVSVALQAHQTVASAPDGPGELCNFQRVTVVARDDSGA
ncbi:hypothetical protein OK074_1741 [Actinobacteria bacterium OK074]|nr:hypothetical protein OK074_1741 [Actinobacteria bacterium OK074]